MTNPEKESRTVSHFQPVLVRPMEDHYQPAGVEPDSTTQTLEVVYQPVIIVPDAPEIVFQPIIIRPRKDSDVGAQE